MGSMKIMTPLDGDKHVEWDPTDTGSVERARKRFDEHVAAGHKAYSVERATKRGTPIDAFDPDAGEILLAPAMAGG